MENTKIKKPHEVLHMKNTPHYVFKQSYLTEYIETKGYSENWLSDKADY